MSNPFKTKAFLELQRKWYKKLEKAGFDDAEDTRRPDRLLKRWHSWDFPAKDQAMVERQREYYSDASWFLEHYKSFTRDQRKIWTRHAAGEPIRDIGKALKMQKDKVHKIIRELQAIMRVEKDLYG